MNTRPSIGFVSLGCPKALVDSERIITQLRSQGYGIAAGYDNANVVVVNTCGFIDSAIEESLEAIGEAMAKNGNVIVTGCLGKNAALIREQYPDVLSISGPHQYESVVKAVNDFIPKKHNPHVDLLPPEGIKLTPRHYAYLKISEGCNHRCRFCIIPSLRGDLVSRPVNQVLAEAKRLAHAGVKELLVISQDTSAYGVDLKYQAFPYQGRDYRTKFYDLCEGLGELGIWVRCHYVYPYPHVDKVIPLMAEGKILPYLDIPLQHANPRILKLMKRPANRQNNLTRIKAWRDICPDITLRSTFIVGFPGETDAEFAELLDFLREAQLDRVGCFKYSPVAGAAANELPDHVPPEVQEERHQQFMMVQAEISAAKLQQKVGKTMTVLVDNIDEHGAIARSSADAPEIDGHVYINNGHDLKPGDFANVAIHEADDYDLYSTLAD